MRIPLFLSAAMAALTAAVHAAEITVPAPTLEAAAWIVQDYRTGKVLAESNADARREPASLTKMMTSYVLSAEIKEGRVRPTDEVAVDESAWSANKKFKDSSLMFIEAGKKVTLDDLHRGVIIQSGNDASVAIAQHLSGSEEAFAAVMNQHAKRMGLKNTQFRNATGLPDPQHYSTARDMNALGIALIRDYPEDYKIYAEKEFVFSGITQQNRNSLLWDTSLNVDGIKTGHTEAAGYCLVTSAVQGNMRLVATVLGAASMKSRAVESKKLLTWAFRNFDTIDAVKAGDVLSTARVWYGEAEMMEVGLARNATLILPRGRRQDLKANFSIMPDLEAPIAKGQEVGKLFLQLDGKDVAEYPLVALKDIPEGGIVRRLSDWFTKKFSD